MAPGSQYPSSPVTWDQTDKTIPTEQRSPRITAACPGSSSQSPESQCVGQSGPLLADGSEPPLKQDGFALCSQTSNYPAGFADPSQSLGSSSNDVTLHFANFKFLDPIYHIRVISGWNISTNRFRISFFLVVMPRVLDLESFNSVLVPSNRSLSQTGLSLRGFVRLDIWNFQPSCIPGTQKKSVRAWSFSLVHCHTPCLNFSRLLIKVSD